MLNLLYHLFSPALNGAPILYYLTHMCEWLMVPALTTSLLVSERVSMVNDGIRFDPKIAKFPLSELVY